MPFGKKNNPAVPKNDESRCEGTNRKGERCKRRKHADSNRFCWAHGEEGKRRLAASAERARREKQRRAGWALQNWTSMPDGIRSYADCMQATWVVTTELLRGRLDAGLARTALQAIEKMARMIEKRSESETRSELVVLRLISRDSQQEIEIQGTLAQVREALGSEQAAG